MPARWRATFGRLVQVNATADPHQAGVRESQPLKLCSLRLFVFMRISTSLPDGKWREVAEAAARLRNWDLTKLPPMRCDTIHLRL